MAALATLKAVPLPDLSKANNTSSEDIVLQEPAKSCTELVQVSAERAFAYPSNSTEDFYRWRPTYHLMPHRNWANDPCGPCYNSADGGYYHMAFQWNPSGWIWGNMSWGHALSRDLVHWQVSSKPSIQPSGNEDPCGVFTGCTLPTNPQGERDGTLTSFYTSAQAAPIHWTLPYQKGSELLRMATSKNQGRTWERLSRGSLVPGPPLGVDATGWRDPYVSRWESVDRCLGREAGQHMYGVMAGGIRDHSPAVFLYSINDHDLTQWDFLCTLFAPGMHFAPSARLPDFGTNWEVTNFITLRDDLGFCHDVLFMSVEGVLASSKPAPRGFHQRKIRPKKARRINRAQNWLCGQVKRQSQNTANKGHSLVAFDFKFGGCMDFGCFYAANSFYDPITDTQIVHGWVTEEDLPLNLTDKQKWSGFLSLPRILQMKCIKGVVSCSQSDLKSLDWINCSASSEGTYTVTTLSSSPDPRLSILRRNAKSLPGLPVLLESGSENRNSIPLPHLLHFDNKSLEIQASFSVPKDVEQIGVELYLSAGKL